MRKTLQNLAVPAAVAASVLIGCSSPPPITDRTDASRPSSVQVSEGYDTLGRKWADQTPPPAPAPAPAATPQMLTREDFVLLHGTGLITAIDHADREMSLQTSDGRIETFTVDKRVKRFNEAKVGDTVSVAYYLGYNAEVRPPTAAEEQNPLVVLDTSSRAGANAPPAASNMRQIRAVVTIEAMDRVNQTLTVKGPRGKYFTARVKDPSRMEQVHIGDTIVMTFTEAAAVSLEPAK